ncbi:putative type 4 fimbrial assembly protein PilB [Catonella morbi ATCC 51271]|uniref:Putative type 4 fimbrial assembly protein PilB n=1 Tax=Catonella morbi ATCC 51271 TaxID=592026 RepID=V2XR56_9FIRM|nr:ATPase, T2SS/T4P/T4SS family [Catonella morbi]ESL04649.1 putative type 4 fimbrial assembly protein PilB [Catonella morbi ATCC 51271]
MAFRREKKRIGDILLEEQIITQEQLEEALATAKDEKKKIGEAVVELGYATEQSIAEALSSQLGFEYVNLTSVTIPENVLSLIGENVLRRHVMIPYAFNPNNMNQVLVAMADPMDMTAIDDFNIVTNLQVVPAVATSNDIFLALDRYYGNTETMKAAQEYAKEREGIAAKLQEGDATSQDVQNSPVVQLVNSMVEQAARQRTSDIHIEAKEDSVRVRFRIDGSLYEKFTYSIHLLPAIMARLKIISGMDIAEKRKPQDGRFSILVDKVEFDIRVSVLPTVYGEKCVMRLAKKKALTRDKSELGFSPSELKDFDDILRNPNGILLVTGPTGSGKSTTLYTALSELNKIDVNIVTVEDPVEANIDGINQVQVNVKADLTFANALRSILRQDPDIIMIGEIRDGETASIAVQASITGHLVVSTLHTNSAAGSINRLVNMGVEGYLLADSLVGIIAQRLVRRLCPYCKRPHVLTEFEKKMMKIRPDANLEIFEPVGCDHCDRTGYSGRIGIYEIMKITPLLKELISRNATVSELKEAAMGEGMHTLRQSATLLVLEGITSYSEMVKTTFEN